MAFLKVIKEIGNFDDAVYAVWQNGGKGLKIDKKKLNMITLPLAQLICSAHANELPTSKEWESLCDYLVSQNSDQLASYVLDVFGNVFFIGVDKELWGQILTMQERIRRAKGDESKLRAFRKIAEPFCNRWNIKFEEIPDFYNGLKNLTGKYGARHRAAFGISEVSDAVTIVVSEETGRISLTYKGTMESCSYDNFLNEFISMMNDREEN